MSQTAISIYPKDSCQGVRGGELIGRSCGSKGGDRMREGGEEGAEARAGEGVTSCLHLNPPQTRLDSVPHVVFIPSVSKHTGKVLYCST